MTNPEDHKLVYMAGPYSGLGDKDVLMSKYMKISGMYMMENPGHHVVSPLFNHYSLHLVPGMGGDYNFWGDYSRNLLKRCDLMLVVMFHGWEESTGVQDEIKTARAAGVPIIYVDPGEYDC